MDDAKYQNNIILCGDWNGHVGCDRRNYELNLDIHSIGDRNEAGKKDLILSSNKQSLYYEHLLPTQRISEMDMVQLQPPATKLHSALND